MKKAIYILIALVILGGVGFYLFSQRDSASKEENEVRTIAPGDELNWSAHFPEVIPEYPEGNLRELSIGEQDTSTRFPNSASAIVDDTNLDEVQAYIDELVSDGWLVISKNIQGEDYSSYQLSFEEYRLGISIGDNILRLSTYTEPEL